MDSFDRQILAVLKDGRSVGFHQILQKVTFSHNTLRLHLASLEREGMIVKAETAKNSPARVKLRHLCRYEKGGHCKKIRSKCAPQNCLQALKNE
jgi:DNA-binding HxlR family transcriptional regulator